MPCVHEFPDNRSLDLRPLATRAEPAPVPGLRRLGGGRDCRDDRRARGPGRQRRGRDLSQRGNLSDDGWGAASRSARDQRRKDSRRRIGLRRVLARARREPDRRPSRPRPIPGFYRPAPSHCPRRAVRRSAARYRLRKISESRRGARRTESFGRESAAAQMDSRRFLRQPLAGRRSVDGGAGRDLDPASDFRLVRERARGRCERHGV